MLSRRPFRKFHNYGLGLVSEILAPLLRMASRTMASGSWSPPTSWKRGLIIGHTRIGDVLFRTCSLEPLKRGLPDCEWHYLAAADSMEVLRHNPFLTSVVSCCHPKHPLQLMPGAVWKLRAMKFDVALCTSPETYWQDHKVALMAGIPNRVGFIHRGLSGLVTHPVCCNYPSSWAGYFQQIVSHLTGAASDWTLIPKIYPSEEDEHCARLQWKKMELPEDTPVLACFMTTREHSHLWPKEYYKETLKLVHEHSGARIALSGSEQDASLLGEFAAGCGVPCKVIAGELGLRGLFCFLKKCSAVLSPDSGPRHIANAAGTPVVFMRNLFCSKIETGRYCENEIDLSPDAEFVPLDQQEGWLRRVTPAVVAQTILQLIRRN